MHHVLTGADATPPEPVVTREVLVGFDSAWTDNPRNPGAITGLVIEGGGMTFHAPRLATFAQAANFVNTLATPDTLLLVAIDQPTIVPNMTGCRPVERVAGSIVNRLKGGVQPGRRGGGGASMFGDDAPIWRFLDMLGLVQDPDRSRLATRGRFAMEVYPALALPSLLPEIWARNRAAKYNPAQRRTFLQSDWHLVCRGLADRAIGLGLSALGEWADLQNAITQPRKADQDRLDAAFCLLIAYHWQHVPRHRSLLIGDRVHGYIVTPSTVETEAILRASAHLRSVPIDSVWNDPDL